MMEYHLTKKSINQLRYAADTVTEQAVDADISLPDYCPDIERILSCTLLPEVHMANVNGDRLSVEGSSCVRVLYLDSEGKLRSYEYRVPFSESLPLKEGVSDCVVYVEAKPEYLNCRALSPRKLSLHGAFSLCVRAAVKGEQSYCVCDIDDLQTKTEKLPVSVLSAMCGETFSVQEDIPLSGKGDVNKLLNYRLAARITDIKSIKDKIMLSAELKLELMLLSGVENPEPECMSYSLPVSRVVNCEGVDENAVIDGELSVMSTEARLSDDALDASALLTLDAKLCFNALCYTADEIEVLTDAFSTDTPTQLKTEPLSCENGIVSRSFTDVGKANVSLDEGIGKILDVHCEKLTHHPTDTATQIRCRMTVAILFENDSQEMRYIERDAEFSYSPELPQDMQALSLRVSSESLSYRLTDDRQLELRAELCYRMLLCEHRSVTAVTGVSAEDDAPARQADSALILYYADTGEDVWDIAKRFSSRPADIIAENDLEGDSVTAGMMLMIPTA